MQPQLGVARKLEKPNSTHGILFSNEHDWLNLLELNIVCNIHRYMRVVMSVQLEIVLADRKKGWLSFMMYYRQGPYSLKLI